MLSNNIAQTTVMNFAYKCSLLDIQTEPKQLYLQTSVMINYDEFEYRTPVR